MNLIDDEQERMLNMLDDVAANPNAEAMAKIEELAASVFVYYSYVFFFMCMTTMFVDT